jgi:hypothetical protein
MQARGFFFTALITMAAASCAASCAVSAQGDGDPVAGDAQRIQGGSAAEWYPEAVLVDVASGGVAQPGCTGALIGPLTVLTSGRCATRFDGWIVTAPFADGQRAHGVGSTVYDFDQTGDTPTTDEHDIGVVFLDAPIDILTYPQIATEPLDDGAEVVGVGRLLDGQDSGSTLYVSPPVMVSSAADDGFLYDYAATGDVIEHGDAGGPDFVRYTHTLVAVNAGSVDGTELLARVDLLNAWIQEQLATAGAGEGDPGWPHGPGHPGHGHGGHGGGGPGGGHGGGHGGGGPGGGPGGGGPGHGGGPGSGGPGGGHGGNGGPGNGGGHHH